MQTVKEIKFVVNLFVVGLLFVIAYAGHAPHNDFVYNPTPPAPVFHVPANCWTSGEGHGWPHHMIAAIPGDGQVSMRGEHWTHIAMENLNNPPLGLDILAFCK